MTKDTGMKYTIDNHTHEYEDFQGEDSCKHCWLMRSTIEANKPGKIKIDGVILHACTKDHKHIPESDIQELRKFIEYRRKRGKVK